MSSAKLSANKKNVFMHLLAGELEKEIPDLDLYSSERRLLDFAYRDLQTCLTDKLNKNNLTDVKETSALNDETGEDEVKFFLKIWTTQWLQKWRERVTFCQKIPQFSLDQIKTKKKATQIFKRMENGQELKKMVVQGLINTGEVCMVELIAESLIIEEIGSRLRINRGRVSSDKNVMDPWSIYQQVASRIKNLAERKTPIIHLKLLTDI